VPEQVLESRLERPALQRLVLQEPRLLEQLAQLWLVRLGFLQQELVLQVRLELQASEQLELQVLVRVLLVLQEFLQLAQLALRLLE
jgi:hypothetical protein